MKKVIVTGGSGKAGKACIADLIEHGYRVLSVDRAPSRVSGIPSIVADLTDFGQVIDAIGGGNPAGRHGVDAVVHLAAIPAPRMQPNPATFRNNMLSDYNVFEACRQLGIRNIVWASSETVLGLPFTTPPPYVPVDEEYTPRPESTYSLVKTLSEEMARQYCRWDPELKIIGLRFSNIMDEKEYERFETWQDKPRSRSWNLWGYIDARDAAQAIRKAIEVQITGAEVFIIANADTAMRRPNAELMQEVFPDVKAKRPFGPHETLLSIDKARRILGYEPQHNWKR